MPVSYRHELAFLTFMQAQRADAWVRQFVTLDETPPYGCRTYTASQEPYVEFFTNHPLPILLEEQMRAWCQPKGAQLNKPFFVLHTEEHKKSYADGRAAMITFLREMEKAITADLQIAVIRLEISDGRLRDLYQDSEEKLAFERGRLDMLTALLKHVEEENG